MYRVTLLVIASFLVGSLSVMAQLKPVLYISFDKDFDGISSSGVVEGNKEDHPLLVAGKNGKALKSGPETGYVKFPTKDIVNQQEGSVEMWICPLDWKLSDREFHVFFEVLGNGYLCLYKYYESVSIFMLSSEKKDSPNFFYSYPAAWNHGEWHHLVGTWTSEGGKTPKLQCFIDGKAWTEKGAPAKLPVELGKYFRIGDNPWANVPRKSSSLVDEVRIYNRALSIDQVAAFYKGNYNFESPLSRELMLLSYVLKPAEKEINIFLNLGYTDIADAKLKVKAAIVPSGKAMPENTYSLEVKAGKAAKTLPMPTMEPGKYEIVAQVFQDGVKFTELRKEVIIPDIKLWENNKIGLEDKVLPPWTPMELNENTVSCWGRKYIFEASPLLTQVNAQNKNLLANPIQLKATVKGKPIQWESSISQRELSSKKTSVQINGTLTAKSQKKTVKLNVSNFIEFDGLNVIKLSSTGSDATTLDSLTLDIPMRGEHVQYRHQWFYVWDKDKSSGFLPKGQGVLEQGKFTPYYWLGDTKQGLFWFCESDEMWPNGQNSNAVQIVRQDNDIILRLNLLVPGQELPANWHFTFGLQATPVKALAKDWRKWRFAPGINNNLDVIWPVAARKDSIPLYGYPEARKEDEPFINRINSLTKRGAKPVLYLFLTWMTKECPEWDFYGKAWEVKCRTTSAEAEDLTPVAINNKDYQDFIVWKTKQFVEKYNIGGAYHDNTGLFPIESMPGGGYVRNGEKYPTYPILAQRQLYKRNYAMYKSLPGETFLIAHTSRSLVIPVLAYEDAFLVGEHFRGRVLDNYMDTFSLDFFRTEIMGRQWGVPSVFLPELGGNSQGDAAKEIAPTRGMMALLMLHDVGLWPIWCNAKVANEALTALDKFGYVDSEFVGYFDSPAPAVTEMKDIYVSMYKRADKRALLIIGNLGRENQKGTITINAQSIGLPLTRVLSWPDNKPVEVVDGKVNLEIPGLGYLMLMIEEITELSAIGNPSENNKWDTSSSVSVRANHGGAGREAINLINGSGLDKEGKIHDNKYKNMWLANHMKHGYPKHAGTVEGGQWVEFKFDKAYKIDKLNIWNYTEGDLRGWAWSCLGMKDITIQYTTVSGKDGWGSTYPNDWKIIYKGQLKGYAPCNSREANNIIDFEGKEARYVVITSSAIEKDVNFISTIAGFGANDDAGLSEVRFYISK